MADDEIADPDELSPTDDTALDRLLHEAARISSPGKLILPGTRLMQGRFVIRRRLGAGGMGVVFEALDAQTGSTVALKTLSHIDAAGIYRIKREFRALADVVHPRLVSLRELFADNDMWFFTMDLIDGVHFNHYVRPSRAGLDVLRLRAALAQLASGVHAIHDTGQLHRDLKPSNVLVAEGPQLAVLDFGLATQASLQGATQTAELGAAGTPAYMAPEQAHGQTATTASDWYAVGVMLFEGLTGRLPYEGQPLDQLLAKRSRSAPPVHTLAQDTPHDLAELCDALLALDPKRRPGVADILQVTGAETSALVLGHASEIFVGRSGELQLLDAALSHTNEGRPVIAHIRGPSGIGKTTLVEHFLEHARSHRHAVTLANRCYERESVPFKAFDGLIDALSRYLLRLSEAEAARLLPRNAQALTRIFPVLGRVDAVRNAPQRRALPDDAIELRLRAFDALKELFFRLAEERPLILAIDDLQWSDRDSARLLKHLLAPPDAPLLLVVTTYRDDEPNAEGLAAIREILEDDVQLKLDIRRIEVGVLSLPESLSLAHTLLPLDAREHVERVAQESAGSPFLIGELAHAADHGISPGDLQRAILRRMDSLPRERRDVQLALCVAPRPVAPELLAHIFADTDVAAALRDLLAKRFAREVASGDLTHHGRGVAPYHDRIRETVLDAMSSVERASWHERFVVALEATGSRDLDVLVDHTLGAGQLEKAGVYARRAARLAAEALAFDRAVALYRTALLHLSLTARERAELSVELAEAFIAQGRCADAAHTFAEAAELAPERALELQRRAAEQFFLNGDLDRGASTMRTAIASAGLDYDALVDGATGIDDYLALRARGFDFEPRDAKTIDPRLLERLDTLWAVAFGTAWHVASIAPMVTFLHEALEVGEPRRVAQGRALLLVVFEASVDPMGAEARSADLYTQLDALDTPANSAWQALCRSSCAITMLRDDMGLADMAHAESLFSDKAARGLRPELNFARIALVGVTTVHRGPAAAATLLEQFLRIADEAGERSARIELRFLHLVALYCLFGYERARAEYERAVELAHGLDSARLAIGKFNMALLEALEGQLERALREMQEAFDAFPITYGYIVYYFRWTRACVLLALAARSKGGSHLLDQVEADAMFVENSRTALGEPIAYSGLAGAVEFLRGQLAAARGEREVARAWLETAAHRVTPVFCFLGPIFRARHADLIGGARGSALRADAEKELTEAGYPPCWLALHAVDI